MDKTQKEGKVQEIEDSDIKRVFGLEYLTTIAEEGKPLRKIGFARRKFVVLDVTSTSGTNTQITIGDSLYELFKSQAEKGDYRSAREFIRIFEKPVEQSEKIY